MNQAVSKGAAVAAAVLGLVLSSGCGGGDEDEDTGQNTAAVKCVGGNECAGMSECAGGPSGNECKGMNECMGQGWDYKETSQECEAAGGMVAS
jgi:hypothetical protein